MNGELFCLTLFLAEKESIKFLVVVWLHGVVNFTALWLFIVLKRFTKYFLVTNLSTLIQPKMFLHFPQSITSKRTRQLFVSSRTSLFGWKYKNIKRVRMKFHILINFQFSRVYHYVYYPSSLHLISIFPLIFSTLQEPYFHSCAYHLTNQLLTDCYFYQLLSVHLRSDELVKKRSDALLYLQL